MIPFPTQTRTWDLNTAANGIWFNDEFAQIYANFLGLEAVVDNQFIAGDTVAAGRAVEYIDGKIQEGIGESQEYGTPVVFEPASTSWTEVIKLTSTKIFIAYTDVGNSNFGTAIVADVSGLIPIFGLPVVFSTSATSRAFPVALTSSKVFISWRDDGSGPVNQGTSIVADIAGTVPTFGSPIVFEPLQVGETSPVKLTNSKIYLSYFDVTNNDGIGIVADIAGTVPTFGSRVIFFNSVLGVGAIRTTALSSSRVITIFSDPNVGGRPGIVKADITGTIPVHTTPLFYNTYNSGPKDIVALSTTKFLVADGNSSIPNANILIGQISEVGDISLHPFIVFASNGTVLSEIRMARLSSKRVIVTYKPNPPLEGRAVIINIKNLEFEIQDFSVFLSNSFINADICALSTNKIIISYADVGNLFHGTVIIGNIAEFLGVAQESKVVTEQTYVTLQGISKAHSGLTIDATYYADEDGILKEDLGKKEIGKAISATEILLTPGR